MTGLFKQIALFAKRTFYLLLLLPGSLPLYAQLPPEEPEIQRPLEKLQSSFYPEPKKPVKSFFWIVDKDTVSQNFFDQSGNDTLDIQYTLNRPVQKSLHTYSDNLKTGSRLFARDMLQSSGIFRYDKNGNLLEWTQERYSYDKNILLHDRTETRRWIIEWNDRGRMKMKYSPDHTKAKTMVSEYRYDYSGRLTEIDQLQWKSLYEYKDGLPVRKTRVFKNDGSVTAASDYTYDANGLLTGSADNHYITAYGYETTGLLKNMTVMKKDDPAKRQDADFYYKDGLLSAVEVRYSDIGMIFVTPAFTMKNSDDLAFSWQPGQTNRVRMEFTYDGHGNVTEIKYFFNDRYRYGKFALYEYY